MSAVLADVALVFYMVFSEYITLLLGVLVAIAFAIAAAIVIGQINRWNPS
jgi:predicted outer membrane lipoprotein